MKQNSEITLTPEAAKEIRSLIDKESSFGIRIGVNTKGCSGMSYEFELVDSKKDTESIIQQDGVNIVIDPKTMLFIIGTEIGFVKDKMSSEFTFSNPMAINQCGCGKSFSTL